MRAFFCSRLSVSNKMNKLFCWFIWFVFLSCSHASNDSPDHNDEDEKNRFLRASNVSSMEELVHVTELNLSYREIARAVGVDKSTVKGNVVTLEKPLGPIPNLRHLIRGRELGTT